jgi:hypothetical protein
LILILGDGDRGSWAAIHITIMVIFLFITIDSTSVYVNWKSEQI